uniref:Uncharacterized protein n=1 Tax=Rhizophora mucronata TaxID=61149 RepID=A0A2P2N9M2_RHIMU
MLHYVVSGSILDVKVFGLSVKAGTASMLISYVIYIVCSPPVAQGCFLFPSVYKHSDTTNAKDQILTRSRIRCLVPSVCRP